MLQQAAPAPRLESPLPGQALQGVVSLSGSTATDGFAAARIEFRYEDDPAQTWFLIQDQISAIENAELASWDSTTITDGTYRLRLTVVKADGSEAKYEVAGVRVRNYSIIETNTPAAGANQAPGPATEITATQTGGPVNATPTPQPPNPAAVSELDLRASVKYGLLTTLGLFVLFAIYLGIRRLGRR